MKKLPLIMTIIMLAMSILTVLPSNYSFADSATVRIDYDAINVRSGAGTDHSVLTVVNSDQVFPHLATETDSDGTVWYQIQVDDTTTGYVTRAYTSLVSDTVEVTNQPVVLAQSDLGLLETTAPALNVRASGSLDGAIIGSLSQGSRVEFYFVSNGWYKINYNGGIGYISADYVTVIRQPGSSGTPTVIGRVTVTTNGLNVRADASTSSTILGVATYGTEFDYYGEANGWFKIKYNNGIAYISSLYAKVFGEAPTVKGVVAVTAGGLKVRSDASTTAEVIGIASFGSQFDYYSVGNGWYMIDYNGRHAYISSLFAKVVTDQPTPLPPVVGQVSVTAGGLKVRSEASSSSVVLGIASFGSQYDYYGEANGWYHINYNGRSAYISSLFAAPIQGTLPQQPVLGVVEVTAGGLKVRSDATTTATVLGIASLGNRFDYYSVGNGWYQINYKGHNAFISSLYAKVVSSTGSQNVTSVVAEVFPAQDAYRLSEPIVIAGRGYGATSILYQFQLKNKDTNQVLYTQNYSSDDVMIWTPQVGGNYTITIEAKSQTATVTQATTSVDLYVQNIQGDAHSYRIQFYGKTLDEAVMDQLSVSGRAVTDVSGQWVQATREQIKAAMDPLNYVQFEYRKDRQPIGDLVINYDNLNVRPTASTEQAPIGQVNAGQKFRVFDSYNNWYQIHYAGHLGWVSGNYITYTEANQTDYTLGEVIRINTDVLNIREQATTESRILGTARYGETFIVLADSGTGWYMINRQGVRGWVSGYYVQNNVKVENMAELTREVPQQMFQFLDLRLYTGVSAASLNNVLKGKGILDGLGSSFVEGSKTAGINEVYLVAHAFLETGHGRSQLANGFWYNPDTDHILDYGSSAQPGYVKVYNMFGIGAFDSNPIGGGVRLAYQNGWTTPGKSVVGGAAWIGRGYINSETNQQYTLYTMKWNYQNNSHQYATDIGWAAKQTYQMHSIYSTVNNYSFRFVLPQYRVVNTSY